MQSSYARKRKRESENATMAALDLPDIPGVPLDVLPEFVYAIRVATKFFAKCNGIAYYGEECRESSTDEAGEEGSQGVLNALMERIASATGPITHPEQDDLSKRRQAMDDAVGRWLASVKRFSKSDDRRRQKREQAMDVGMSVGTKGSELKTAGVSVAYACFLYIWDLQQTHKRIAVRRAGLYFSGLLLQRSKDCRCHLESEDNLGQWLQSTFFNYHPVKAAEDSPFFHLEADFWLNHLVENGYGRMYPKIQVALQRLRQQCPILEATNHDAYNVSETTFSSMNDWRHIRDTALAHGDKEIKCVEKWLRRAQTCMETLVPRLGINNTSITSGSMTAPGDSSKDISEERSTHDNGHDNSVTNTKNGDFGNYDEDDEDDDIGWEDGYTEAFDDGVAERSLRELEHFRAVERTLVTMEESAGGLRCGGIEIDFRDDPSKDTDDDIDMKCAFAISEDERNSSFVKLIECESVLGRKHKPRLTMWLEGLTNADNLVVSKRSLISLSSDVATKRSKLEHRLAELLGSISRVLSSAQRLRLKSCSDRVDDSQTAGATESDDAPLFLRLSSSSRNGHSGRKNVLSTALRKQKLKKQGSRLGKVRIKFLPR